MLLGVSTPGSWGCRFCLKDSHLLLFFENAKVFPELVFSLVVWFVDLFIYLFMEFIADIIVKTLVLPMYVKIVTGSSFRL